MNNPLYAQYLQYAEQWVEVDRETLVEWLKAIGIPFARLTRLEDKRIWEVYYDLDQLGFQFDTADELIDVFKMKCHPALFMALTSTAAFPCIGNEVRVGLLVLAESKPK